MRESILLFVNGREHRVSGADAFLTLSDFLRNRLSLCGTKIVCSEGDCGSCSTLCGRLNDEGKSFNYQSIDSCIRFVFQLDRCHIVTVEGLGKEERLHPVQEAMVNCHGSQCGFCTPGFVMSMAGILEQNDAPSEEDWRYGLTGNLCRCTGYSPILEAGNQLAGCAGKNLSELYPANEMISKIETASKHAVRIENDQSLVYCPSSLSEATEFLAKHPDAEIIAGATETGVRFNKGLCSATVWLDLNAVDELAGVTVDGDKLVIGARATWTDLEEITQTHAEPFHGIVEVFGSPQIRNVATIGGNIINASPIADSLPFLVACDATLTLVSKQGSRTVAINDFFQGYKQIDLKPGELLHEIRMTLPPADRQLRLYKVSRRRDMDISTFTGAIWVDLDGDTIKDAGIAYGAVGPTILRLKQTETFLRGKPFSLDIMTQAGDVALKEITPISDVRGGQDFRNQLAKNVLQKFFHEVQANSVEAIA
ncbi:FAD binding domain-containing protein [Mariniblastus sp.]|nr:FAD binding domain-containing protein [Mariniblastus sp.]